MSCTSRFGAVGFLVASLLLWAISACSSHEHAGADERDTIQFLEPGQPNPIRDEMEASLDEITVREVNQFHLALLDRCVERTPADQHLRLSYGGIVATHTGDDGVEVGGGVRLRTGQRVVGSIGSPIKWSVSGKRIFVYFSMWISVRKTEQTVTEWDTGKRTLYVNLSFIDGDWKSRDEKRPELGDRSIIEFLSLVKEKNPAAEE